MSVSNEEVFYEKRTVKGEQLQIAWYFLRTIIKGIGVKEKEKKEKEDRKGIK